MNRLNRRRFLALGAASTASVVLVACGNESPADTELSPTQIPDVAGAPPTLAPITSTPQSGGGGEQADGETGGGEGGAAPAETVTILALDSLAYDPSEMDVSPGQTLVLQNDGFLQHDIAVDEWGGSLTPLLNNGETAEFTIPEDAAVGDAFTYFCSVPGHREGGMEGTFTIVEAGAAAAPAGEEAPAEAATAEEGAAAGATGEAVTIAALDSLAFDPSEVEVSPGQTVTLRNDGFLQHDLAVDDWGGALTPLLNNGETADFTIPEDAAVGESFEYYCTVPGHKEGGMVGTFTIVEGGGAAAAPAEEAPAEEATAEGEGAAAATAEEGAAGGGEAITILALDTLSFDPSELEVSPGQAITLQNDGFLQHDLAVDEWGGALTPLLNNGETAEFTIPEDAAVGESFEYYCTVPGHKEGGMVGTFTIVEGGGAAAAAPAGEEAPAEAATAEEGAAAGATGEAVTILALDTLAFDPAELEVSPGQTLTLQNDGFLQHDLAVDDWGGALTPLLNNGETAEFTIPEDAAVGEQFEYYCTVPGHKEGGMVGTFTVVEGSGAAAAPAGEEAPEEAATAESTPATAAASTEDIVVDGIDPSEAAVQVVATEWQFEPADFEIAPGETIALINRGTVAHGMSAEAFGGTFIDPVGAGHSDSFTIPEDAQVGDVIEYTATNQSAANLGMGGTITIVEGSGSATPAASPQATPAAGGGAGASAEPITILAMDTLSFDPSEVDVVPGQTVTLQNDGFLQHDLAVDDWGGALTPMLNNGETADFTIPEDAAVGEEFEYYCTVPGHYEGGMRGTFTIVEG